MLGQPQNISIGKSICRKFLRKEPSITEYGVNCTVQVVNFSCFDSN